jgi:anti-sigma factor RsiW
MRHLFSPGKRDQERRDELLSAYLDDELSDRERERLEAQLAADADLRSDLEALRRTVAMTRDLPTLSAPRNFILSPSMVEQAPQSAQPPRKRQSQALGWAAPILTAVTATVSLLFVLVLAGDLLLGGVGFGAPPRQEASPMAMEAAPTEEPVESERAGVAATEAPPSTLAEAPEEEMSAGEEGAVEKEAEEAAEAEADEAPTLEPTMPLPTPALTPTVTAPSEIPTDPVETTPVPREGVGVVEPTPEDWENVTPTPLIVESDEESVPERAAPSRVTLWRALEITLGLTAVVLLVVTIRAWRDRR